MDISTANQLILDDVIYVLDWNPYGLKEFHVTKERLSKITYNRDGKIIGINNYSLTDVFQSYAEACISGEQMMKEGRRVYPTIQK